jgi:hypothetical protein
MIPRRLFAAHSDVNHLVCTYIWEGGRRSFMRAA